MIRAILRYRVSAQSCLARTSVARPPNSFSPSRSILPPRTLSTASDPSATAKAERLARLARANESKSATANSRTDQASASRQSSNIFPILASIGAALGGLLYAIIDIKQNPNGTLGKLYKDSWLETTIQNMSSDISSVYLPSSEKLIPDFESGPFYGQIPPGSQPPPLLVLDLEKTLIGSDYDAKYGWRHVKRPGLKTFIDRMSQYYEIVIISENDLLPEIIMAVDPDNKCHKCGPPAMEVHNGHMLKRLDLMNRDLSRIILIDDSTTASSLFPRNTLLVPPFDDIHSRDTVLEDLMVLLQAVVHDGVADFRSTFDDLGTREATEAVVEYKMRVDRVKQEMKLKRERGLGGLLKKKEVVDEDIGGSGVLARIVGDAPTAALTPLSPTPSKPTETLTGVLPSPQEVEAARRSQVKKKGALFQWLEDSDAEKARLEELKIQRMNEIHFRKMREKAEREEKARVRREEGI